MLKVLILIISSDTEPVYAEHRKIWLAYMNSNPQIKCYFIQYRDGVQALEGNTFWLSGKESFDKIINKTIDSFDFFIKSDSYDFIIRTNMSTLWNFKALIAHLETLPRQRVYNGQMLRYQYNDDMKYIAGSGIILSQDIAKLIVENRELVESIKIIDDVDIGFALKKLGIQHSEGNRIQIRDREMYDNFTYNSKEYQYRIKWNDRSVFSQEIEVMQELFKKIITDKT
jgi:hypothetical protein